jgi:hypothetical protein
MAAKRAQLRRLVHGNSVCHSFGSCLAWIMYAYGWCKAASLSSLGGASRPSPSSILLSLTP